MSDQLEMFWFLIPRKDENYQWWWGYHKVRPDVLPESDKQKYLERMNSDVFLQRKPTI